jgi:hypothetical protein
MRIKGSEVTRRTVEVEVDQRDVLLALKVKAYQSVGIPFGAFLDRDGQLVYDEENYHGSDSRILITKEPSELQINTIKAFDHILAVLLRD